MIVFRFGKGILNRPTQDSNAPINYPMSKAQMFVPVRLIHGNAIKGNFLSTYARSVVCLLFSSSPSAVTRLIISITINAIKGMFFRGRFAHIAQKLLKVIDPFKADFYSFLNMPFISRIIREGVTSTLHVSPCLIFFSFCHEGILSQSGHIFKGVDYGRR
jgi:hypothetical protein